MPLQKIQFRPGVVRETTTYANEGGWYDCDKIRFRSGFPQKLGGWQNINDGAYTFIGVARALWPWSTISGADLTAFGTNQKYYIEYGTQYYDITPIRSSVTNINNNPFSTVSGSKLVTVTDTSHNATAGSFVTFSSATTVAGLDMNGEFEIITVIDTDTYTVLSDTAANATTTGGGASVDADYQINAGSAGSSTGNGWGVGAWPNYTAETLTNPFTATGSGVTVLTVTQTAHGLDTGDYVYFSSIQSAPCGVTNGVVRLEKAFEITKIDADSYTISIAPYTTTSGTASGGTVVVDIPALPTRGWGEGADVTVTDTLTLWSQDNYGENLIFSQRDGDIYYWDTNISTFPRAVYLSAAATTAGYAGTFVPHPVSFTLSSGVQRFVIAIGANPYDPGDANTAFDPMLVRWSDQEDPFQWVPSASNQAGEQRLSHGSYLIAGQITRQEILIWSDTALYSMKYLGPPYIWGFTVLMDNTSIASPNAATTVSNVTYWMGIGNFYSYSGRVQAMPCTVRQFVFGNFNITQADQVVSGSNETYYEVWWFYPSANSQVNDRYVIYNYAENVWYYGSMYRTAWFDNMPNGFPWAAYSMQVSYLSESIDDSVTTLPLITATSYPTTGTVVIGSEQITYTGTTASALTGCVRGANGTTAATHDIYDEVAPLAPNQLMYHEYQTDDGMTNPPTSIYSYIQSADFDIGDGHNFSFVWRMLPDLTFAGSNPNSEDGENPPPPEVTIKLKPRGSSGSAYTVSNSPTVTGSNTDELLFTGEVYTRIRGRQMAFRIESTEMGVNWQLGVVRIDIRPDGRR